MKIEWRIYSMKWSEQIIRFSFPCCQFAKMGRSAGFECPVILSLNSPRPQAYPEWCPLYMQDIAGNPAEDSPWQLRHQCPFAKNGIFNELLVLWFSKLRGGVRSFWFVSFIPVDSSRIGFSRRSKEYQDGDNNNEVSHSESARLQQHKRIVYFLTCFRMSKGGGVFDGFSCPGVAVLYQTDIFTVTVNDLNCY